MFHQKKKHLRRRDLGLVISCRALASVCHTGYRRLTRKVWHVLLSVLGSLFHSFNVCVFFSSFSVAAYPQGFFFFCLPYLHCHLSTVYLCQHWAQTGAWERQASSVLSPMDRGGALVCEAFVCVYVRVKGPVAKSLPLSVLATSAGKAAWRIFPPCCPPHLCSPLPASPDAAGGPYRRNICGPQPSPLLGD